MREREREREKNAVFLADAMAVDIVNIQHT